MIPSLVHQVMGVPVYVCMPLIATLAFHTRPEHELHLFSPPPIPLPPPLMSPSPPSSISSGTSSSFSLPLLSLPLTALVEVLDADQNGVIDMEEWQAAVFPSKLNEAICTTHPNVLHASVVVALELPSVLFCDVWCKRPLFGSSGPVESAK